MKQLIVTCLPSFYKNLAFRKIADLCSLKVFYTFDSEFKREGDFFHYALNKENIVKKTSLFNDMIRLYQESKKVDYVTLGGWDDFYFWFLRLVVPKRKLRLIVESTIYEFKDSKILTPIKKLFLRGISECIASGEPHRRLVIHLGFKGKITLSKGVGILDFNYEVIQKTRPESVEKFLYVGRLSEEKGIDLLLDFFEKNQDIQLNIVGSVENEKYAESISRIPNIKFHGYKSRDELQAVFSINDVLILASNSETWGLVVEEALYHGLPLIVSNKVGCSEDLVKAYNTGLVFNSGDLMDLTEKIEKITDIDQYMMHCKNINSIDFKEMSNNYINCFL